jgi:hypothetical protein
MVLPPLALRTAFWVWLIAALAAGQFLWLQRLPMPAIQGILAGLTVLLVLAYRGWKTLRTWVDALDLRVLVLVHVTRFIGFYFITLYDRGELPYAFAVPGGIGDIIVAALALIAAFAPMSAERRRHALSIWNVVGFIDLILVVVTAARLGWADPAQMQALTHLPLSLLPTFLVPLLFASHLALFARLAPAKQA